MALNLLVASAVVLGISGSKSVLSRVCELTQAPGPPVPVGAQPRTVGRRKCKVPPAGGP